MHCNVNQVYMINLKRQTGRRRRMVSALNELQFQYSVVDAVDGKWVQQQILCHLGLWSCQSVSVTRKLTNEDLEMMGIKPLPGYRDPILKRSVVYFYKVWCAVCVVHSSEITMGEIACFLSHYKLWKEVCSSVVIVRDRRCSNWSKKWVDGW